ncbi:MAG TPA: M13 family metallopeptidase [Bacteroidia bacterium]|nr:M13 family metallopeptidase [Bacteroidia bacterium]
MKKRLLLPVTLLMIWSCSSKKNEQAGTVTQDDFLWQWLDTTVSPGTDFFKYATGTWMKQNPIPESERRWGIANLVRDDNYAKLRQLSDEAAADKTAEKGSNSQKIGDFWSSGMDSATIEKLGIEPLKAEFEKINNLKNIQDVVNLIADYQVNIGSPLFSPAIYQDEKNSERYALHFYQGGIGLPDRDYYFNTDSRTANIRKEYVLHLSRMFGLLGEDGVTANRSAAAVMKLETELAKASRKLEDLRDPYANYNKMSVEDFTKITPSIPWKEIMERMNLKNIDSVIVGQPEFYTQVEKSLKTVSLQDWKTYLRWNLVNSFTGQLSSAFEKESFNFYGTVMSGVKTQRPRWKRVLDEEEGYLGDALGQLYVSKYVPQSMRERYDALVQNMLDTYKERIMGLTWMGDSTKQKALYKLSKINRKVCFPDRWKNYSKLNITSDSYLQNVMNCRAWSYAYEVDKLYKPVDRTEWEMTPQTYNAYYNPSNNEIVLPAAQFLIPGLPDSLADDAIIYGYAAASTIGHELTHGFDDQGRQFDANGNLQNWWTADDSIKFMKQANILVKQFSDFVVLDSLHVNGEASLGENIADLGGVVIGLEAFKKTEQYKKGEKIDGLTPLQRYFLGYTLGWLGHARDASLAMQVMTDVHAPNFLRVNGPLSNVPEFYEAFGIKEGDPMWRPDSLRVKIW